MSSRLVKSYSGIFVLYIVITPFCTAPDPTSRWVNVCRYGMFHGGDSDSTGIIAGACYGAMFGLEGVPLNNYSQIEFKEKLEKIGGSLFLNSHI